MNEDRSGDTLTDFGLGSIVVGGGLAYVRRMQVTFSCVGRFHGSVVDIGCGTGKHCAEVLRRGADHYVGIDISATNIKKAQASCRTMNADFICADVTKIPLSANYFDFALCNEVLEHIQDEHTPIREIYRIMRKGGLCVFSVPSLSPLVFLFDFVASRLGKLSDRPYRAEDHWREYSKYEFDAKFTTLQHLRQLIEGSGLTIVK